MILVTRCRKYEDTEGNKTDTLVIVKTDTLVKEVEKLITKTDTIFVYVDTTYDEPACYALVEKTYEDEHFKAVVSGPSIGEDSPSLKHMEVYPETKYEYVTNEVVREVESRRWELYVTGDICLKKSGDFASLGILATTPHGFAFGPKIGVLSGELFAGGTVGYRLSHRR